jgi:mannitol 2-dehydrogenase
VHEAMEVAAVRSFLEDLLHREAMPTLSEIPGHPRAEYAATVVERFANHGVRDQIARLCIDGSAKFPIFLIPTVERQLASEGPVSLAATALAAWARYLGVVDPQEQSYDADAEVARRHAAEARSTPEAFLEYEAVFPPAVRTSDRFRAAFVDAYRRISEHGPLAAASGAPR